MTEYLPILYAILALGGLGVLFGLLLGVADKKFSVEADERVSAVRAAVAGANCGACGYPGCDGFAEALANGTGKITGCAAGGSALAESIAAILGVEAVTEEPKIAFLKCGGSNDKTVKNCVYYGEYDCRAASVIPGKGPYRAPMGVWDLGHVSAYARLTR